MDKTYKVDVTFEVIAKDMFEVRALLNNIYSKFNQLDGMQIHEISKIESCED